MQGTWWRHSGCESSVPPDDLTSLSLLIIMISSSVFQQHLSVPESVAAGRVPDAFLNLIRSVREAGTADDLTDKIAVIAGIGIACLYCSRAARVWISSIPDPTMPSLDAIGRIPCHTGGVATCPFLPFGGHHLTLLRPSIVLGRNLHRNFSTPAEQLAKRLPVLLPNA